MSLIMTLRARLNEVEMEAESLEQEVKSLVSRLEHTRRLIQLYRMTLEQEKGTGEEATAVKQDQIEATTRDERVQEVPASGEISQLTPSGLPANDAVGTAIAAVRNHIVTNLSSGFVPGDILRFVMNTGLSTNRAFAYNAIKRLKDGGELLDRGGRYYPTSKLTEAVST